MINQIVKNKLSFISATALLFVLALILQLNLILPLFLLSLILYLRYRKLYLRKFTLLHVSFLYTLVFFCSYTMVNNSISKMFIPFAAIPMLATLLFGQLELALLITIAGSLTVASLSGNNLYLGVLFLISGVLSSVLVLNARRRSTIIRAGFVIGIVQAVSLLFIDRFWFLMPQVYLKSYLFIFLNGIASSVIVLGVLPVFEYLFGTVTNISLLELADFNQPVLQRMIMEAPGTYHHSLVVGNLSESACRAVGANALLARIGAYYHDIGKLEKAEYFSENQDLNVSKHDKLAPTMSKLIIMNHVKEGVEMAKKYRLNPALVDFIEQHHGNSLVYYFYRRALEGLEEDQQIKEEGFRYPGPKPKTKETAIVLLADSVEAATRALRDPAPQKVEELVHKVINNKFIDGQLDECDLTLKDLERISAVFIKILSGIYHSRIVYPEDTRSDNHKKSSKENSHLSEKDKKSNS